MLRSTSVKNDIWKPVKLLARQSVEGPILHSSCNFRGDIVAVLTASNFSIFNNRELLCSISLNGGKKLHVTGDASSIFVLTDEKLYCYNTWGEIKWEYDEIDNQTFISISKSGNNIALSKGNNLQVLNRFGNLKSNISFDSEILSLSQSSNKTIVVLTPNSLIILVNGEEKYKVDNKSQHSFVYCSSDNIMVTSNDSMAAFSYSGNELWVKEYKVDNLTFSNGGIKHVFIKDSKTLVCQDRNGDKIWDYSSREDFDGATIIESGKMAGIFSNNVFHVIDEIGQQSWSYQARERIVNFSFSNHGGDVIIASENKVHWFQNEGFLRMQMDDAFNKAENLFEKVSIYEPNLEPINRDIQKAQSMQTGNFNLISESFQLIYEVNNRLSSLQQRHVGYLDALPAFLEVLGLRGAQTDEMIPLLYPYYSLHSDLQDTSYIDGSIQKAENVINKLTRFDNISPPTSSSDNHKNFLRDAKVGVLSEIDNLRGLIESTKKDIKSLENNIKILIIDWLKTAELDSEPKPFLSTYQKSSDIRESKIRIINDKIDNHIAFVNYNDDPNLLVLSSSSFSAKESVSLNLDIKNVSSQKIDDIFLRIKVEGTGISLAEPPSGVIRLNHLKPSESVSPSFNFNPVNRSFTKIAMVLQYHDELSRLHTIWLGEIEADFLGCYIQPLELDASKHDALRLDYQDNTTHSVVNIEGLSIKKLTNISKNLPGLYLCDCKIENTRSILYHSGKSSLDDSQYLSMIFIRTVGNEDSLRTVLELICHAPSIDNSAELKEELLSYLKNKFLAASGRLV
jgi:hypothetical protein